MRSPRYGLLCIALTLFVSSGFAKKQGTQQQDGAAPPLENLIVNESPYAQPYLPQVVGTNQTGWRCDANGNRDNRNLDGTCYDLNGATFRIRTTINVGRGAIESVFRMKDGKPVLWARFDRKNERNQNALLWDSEEARQFAASNGRVSATGSSPGASPRQVPASGPNAPEEPFSKALGGILNKLKK